LLEPPRIHDDERAVTILHVSDMQFGKHHRFADPDGGFDTLLRRLCDDLDLLARENGLAPDLGALTGDLAEWGMKREFDQVAVFGEGLLAHLKLDPDRLLVIPGNHDINRKL
jgi:3',5'-cyclic AMP phosphodiesterase CpdA